MIPSNEGRGYVLRKVIRRALLNVGRPENSPHNVLPDMAEEVCKQYEEAYPELRESLRRVVSVLKAEVGLYARTMNISLRKLNEELDETIEKA